MILNVKFKIDVCSGRSGKDNWATVSCLTVSTNRADPVSLPAHTAVSTSSKRSRSNQLHWMSDLPAPIAYTTWFNSVGATICSVEEQQEHVWPSEPDATSSEKLNFN